MLPNDEGYQLFRQAIVERVADAWLDIITHYRPLLISWAATSTAGRADGELAHDIADEALARAWVALTPERFATFPNVAAILAYLHMCVTATAIDQARTRARTTRIALRMSIDAVATPDEIVLHNLAQTEFWRLLMSIVRTDQERVVLTESLMHKIPPRIILQCYPDLFHSITEVYTTMRNLFDRLRRNVEVQCLSESAF